MSTTMAAFPLKDALTKINFSGTLKPKQLEILDFIFKGGKEALGVLPTGYGKSLIYQVLPFVLGGKVIVFSPLTVIQEEQIAGLANTQLKCCILNTQGRIIKNIDLDEEVVDIKSSVPLEEVFCCGLVFAHPEALFSTTEGKMLLRNDRFTKDVRAVVFDECHKVDEWGKNFRKAFKNLRDVPAYFPGAPRLGLSATVTVSEEKGILESLGMLQATIFKESPDRPNIFLEKIVKDSFDDIFESYFSLYEPFCQELLEKGNKFPVTLMYMPLMYIGDASAYCRHIFKNPSLDTCLYGMLCSGQDEKVKRVITAELGKPEPRIRLVFCTSVIGMGFNSPSIERVIHCKPPRNLPDYVQEIGRAGRSGQDANAILYFCKRDISSNIKDLNKNMVEYCNEQNCLRDNLLNQFGFTRTTDYDHKCCSYCRSSCKCFECEMFRIEL